MESPYQYFFSLFVMFITLILCAPFSECNVELVDHDLIKIELPPNVTGPDSVAFDCNGEGPYTGVYDGRILKWGGSYIGWTEFAITSPLRKSEVCDGSMNTSNEEICGRPLGLEFHPSTCDLYIADAYYGLLVVGPKGGLATQLASSAEGVPFRFTHSLDIDVSSGLVYFTDSSAVYQRREVLSILISGDKSGRLMKYDIEHTNVTILVNYLQFPTGIALSQDKDFLLFAQTSLNTTFKYRLKGPKSETSKIFKKFNGYPSNIARTENGDFWIAIEEDVVAGVKVDGEGKLLEVLNETVGEIALVNLTEIREVKGSLWIGSYSLPYLGFISSA